MRLAGRDVEVSTAGGIFSPDHVDAGTSGAAREHSPAPSRRAPARSRVRVGTDRAVARAGLTARDRLGGRRQRACSRSRCVATPVPRPHQHQRGAARRCSRRRLVPHDPLEPADPRGQERVARNAAAVDPPHLDERSDGWLVVQRNLGSDSLQRWLAATFAHGYSVQRAATGRGFRVIRVRRHGTPPTGPSTLPSRAALARDAESPDAGCSSARRACVRAGRLEPPVVRRARPRR